MPTKANKVKFNLHNVHYAVMSGDGTWETPVPIPGAVSLTLDAQGQVSPFYADGIVYYQTVSNSGYSGSLEVALIPKSMFVDVFGYEEGETSKVLTENSLTEPKAFALLFEEDGDASGTKYVFYNCSATRPSRTANTTNATKPPTTQSLSLSVAPMADGKVFAVTTEDTPEETASGWFTSVFTEGAA